MPDKRREYDNGAKKYVQYLPIAIVVVSLIAGYVSLQKDVEAGQKEQEKIVKTVKENSKDIQTVKTDVAVIKERQKTQTKTLEMILREVRK
tara:strand:+ start:5682 stop:5954 length:273 start_codon:yes stop_codon:yes gene_type:complete